MTSSWQEGIGLDLEDYKDLVKGNIGSDWIQANNNLVAALDPHDSVGILDRFSNDVQFFKEYERFDRYLEKMKLQAENKCVHYISICSPNYLHDAHIRFSLRSGSDVICEKPIVLNPWDPMGALAK